MKEFLTKNLILKLISLGLAFFTWISVVNISNPEITVRKQIPVEIINENVITEQGKTYEIEDDMTVYVSYTVRSRDEYKISASDFRAYIDMKDLYDVTGSVPIQVEVLKNENLITSSPVANPRVMHVTLDEYVRIKLGVSVIAVGNPADGYYVKGAEVSPGTIVIRGPKNVIGNVSYARIDVDVEDASGSLSGSGSVRFCNSAGDILEIDDERVSTDIDTVSYQLYIDIGEAPETEPETMIEPTAEPSPGMNPTVSEVQQDSTSETVASPTDTSESPENNDAEESSPEETTETQETSESTETNENTESTEGIEDTESIESTENIEHQTNITSETSDSEITE